MSRDWGDFAETRRQQAEPATPEPQLEPEARPASDEAYSPWGTVRGQQLSMLDLKSWARPGVPEGDCVSYNYIVKMHYIGEQYLSLVLTNAVIEIEGFGLGDLRQRLITREIAFIQEYSPHAWPEQILPGQPVITRITAHQGQSLTEAPAKGRGV